MSDSEDQAGVPLIEHLSDSDAPAPQTAKKRKRDTEVKRSAKRRELKKPQDIDDEALDTELGVNNAIAQMDSRLMADHLAQRTRRFRTELSTVEMEDCYVPEQSIRNTTSSYKPRTAEYLSNFLEQFAGSKRRKKFAHAPPDKGTPHTLVVAGSGIRAADLTRSLRKYQTKDALVAKLFAKHIKLKESIEIVKHSRISIGVGTPKRLSDLIESGALKVDALERVVVDASHIDVKKKGIMDMRDTLVSLVELLTRKELRGRYDEKRTEVLFF